MVIGTVAVANHRVISVGSDSELLSLRHAVLESAGFSVFTTANPHEAIARLQENDWGVLLLCYSLDDATRQRIAKEFREHCPGGRIIAITNQPVSEPPVDADVVLYGLEGAEALINVVRGKALA